MNDENKKNPVLAIIDTGQIDAIIENLERKGNDYVVMRLDGGRDIKSEEFIKMILQWKEFNKVICQWGEFNNWHEVG